MPFLKTFLFLIVAPGFFSVLVPYWILNSDWNRPFDIGAFHFLGLPLLATGAFGLLWCFWDFATFGKGTPAPIDPPKVFVSRGLYLWTRNPMYVAIAFILTGEALFFQSWTLLAYAFFIWLGQHLFVLLYEEPTLKKKFGPEYETYLKTVPRWLPQKPK